MYEHDHEDQSDEIDQAVHDFLSGFTYLSSEQPSFRKCSPCGRARAGILTTFDAEVPGDPDPGSVEPAGVNSITLLSAVLFYFFAAAVRAISVRRSGYTGGARFPSPAPELRRDGPDELGFEFFRLFAVSNDTAGLYRIANRIARGLPALRSLRHSGLYSS
jgi:hypothetical protein